MKSNRPITNESAALDPHSDSSDSTHVRDDVRVDSDRCEAASRGSAYLKSCLQEGNYGLSCLGNDGMPRFSHNKGHLFSAYFLARALDGSLSEVERSLLITRIISEERDGLWGYSPAGPLVAPSVRKYIVDADDTSFVIRTCRQLGLAKSSDRLLTFYQRRNLFSALISALIAGAAGAACNGFKTFASRTPARLVLDPSPANNLQLHPEVNINVFAALQETELEHYIDYSLVGDAQDEAGSWRSYFYPSPFYATWLALELIRGRPVLEKSRDRGMHFLISSQHEDGSWGKPGNAYETALAVCGLKACQQDGRAVERGVAFLLRDQRNDGAWTTQQPVWRFHADGSDVWTAFDSNHVVATSLSVCALNP